MPAEMTTSEENEQFDKRLFPKSNGTNDNTELSGPTNMKTSRAKYRDGIKTDKITYVKEQLCVLYKSLEENDVLDDDLNLGFNSGNETVDGDQVHNSKDGLGKPNQDVVSIAGIRQVEASRDDVPMTEIPGAMCEGPKDATDSDCRKIVSRCDHKHLSASDKGNPDTKPLLDDGTRRNRKPLKCKNVTKRVFLFVTIITSLAVSGLALGHSRMFPFQQTPTNDKQMQSVTFPMNWNHTSHLLPNISWSSPKVGSESNLMNRDKLGIRIQIKENAMYEAYLHLTIDSSSVDFSKRKSKTVGSIICLQSSKGTPVCDRHVLLPGTGESVSLKTVVYLQNGDSFWVTSTGVNLLYYNNAGNYLTVTKYP